MLLWCMLRGCWLRLAWCCRCSIGPLLTATLLDEALIVKTLRRPSDGSLHWSRGDWSGNNLTASWEAFLARCSDSLTIQPPAEVCKHIRGKCVALLPDLDHVRQLVFLLLGHILEGLVEHSGHQFGNTLNCCRIAATFSAAFNVEILSTLLCLFEPFPNDAIDYVDRPQLVSSLGLFEGAVEGLHDLVLCLQVRDALVMPEWSSAKCIRRLWLDARVRLT